MQNTSPSTSIEPVALLTETVTSAEEPKPSTPPSSAEEPASSRPTRRRKPSQKALIRVAVPTYTETDHISLNHHEAHCTVCNHPARKSIEQGFLHWQRASALAREFHLGDRRVVYRHALALGLYEIRAARSRRALEFIMEQAENVEATADTVIRAVRAHSCISEDGHWTEPSKRVHVTHEYRGTPAEKLPA